MSTIELSTIELMLKNLNGALKSRKLYPAGHPGILQPLEKAYQILIESLKIRQKIFIGKMKDVIVFEDNPIIDSIKNLGEVLLQMDRKALEGIIFEKGLSKLEWTNFFEILSLDVELKGQELQKAVSAKGIKYITLKSLPFGKRNIVEVYNNAIDIVQGAFAEVRAGRIPKTENVAGIVNEITDHVLEDHNAMIGLTMIKNYDDYLFNHSVNVGILSVSIGKTMGCSKEKLFALGIGGFLHDIGKTGVTEDIIRKPGGLSSEEWEKVKLHPVMGSKIIERMENINKIVPQIVFEHHIRYDHSGYPTKDGELNPLSTIITIADAYDALTTLRVYQKPYPPASAIKIMQNLSGRHFDPDTLKIFVNMFGVYPVGTMVRLCTNEVGIVIKVEQKYPDKPVVKLIFDSNGIKIDKPFDVDLTKDARGNGLQIVSPVDPIIKDIDVGNFMMQEAKSPNPQAH